MLTGDPSTGHVPGRLRILYVASRPSSPPRFGGQVRQHGLMTNLARRHAITAVTLVDHGFDPDAARTAMRRHFEEVTLVANPNGKTTTARRRLQLRSSVSLRSQERHWVAVPALEETVDRLLSVRHFDAAILDFPIAPSLLRSSSPSPAHLPLVLNTHGIEHDLSRQIARRDRTIARIYRELNWRKLRRDELAAFRASDGICLCSANDQTRLLAGVPSARTALIPNAADVDHYQRRPSDPPPDGETVLFFGLLSVAPNADGALFFLREIWPTIARQRPQARCRIIGARPALELFELAGPRVEITGFVEDLRTQLAKATVLVVPLRLGTGTRLKILEGMAMGLAIVQPRLASGAM